MSLIHNSLTGKGRSPIGPVAALSSGLRAGQDISKAQAPLCRGPNVQPKLLAAPWTQTWPAPGSTLDLDFANDRGFVRGSGQGKSMDALTFTRASSATYVGADGTLKGCGAYMGALGNNLLPYPEYYTSWSFSQASIKQNGFLSPSGTMTASALICDTSNNIHVMYQNPGFTGVGTLSFYAKAGQWNYCSIATTSFNYIHFNLTNGNISTLGNGWANATCTLQSDGWYRITATNTSSASWGNVQIFALSAWVSSGNSSPSCQGDGISGILIWGAQLEVGSSATAYYPTNVNSPRFDWGSTSQLMQNLFCKSQQIGDGTLWLLHNSVTATINAATAPDGTSTASSIVPTTASNLQRYMDYVSQNITQNGNYVTQSVYAKKNGYNYLMMMHGSVTSCFDLNAGTVTYQINCTANISSVGNGWYLCSTTFLEAASNSSWYYSVSDISTNTWRYFTGDGTSGIYLWGAQLTQTSTVQPYQAQGAFLQATTPLQANPTCNGLLIEESRTNRLLWCRDASISSANINYLKYSQLFSNAMWTPSNVQFTDNATTAPDSTNTATKIAKTNGQSGGGSVNQSVGYGWPGSGNNMRIVSLVDGSLGSTLSGSFASLTATDAGFGWWRIIAVVSGWTFSFYAKAAGWNYCAIQIFSSSVYIYASQNSTDIGTGDGTNGIYIWGAQVSYGSTVVTYESTTTSAAIWSKQSCTAAKTATGIDGVANSATTLTASSNNAVCIQPIVLASGSRTSSVYLKRVSGSGTIQVTLDGSTWSTVDLSNGLWNRCVLSGTVTNPCVGVLIATSGDVVAMDYGQVEDGGTVTSPILTTTATVTRATESNTISMSLALYPWYKHSYGTICSAYQRSYTTAAVNYYLWYFKELSSTYGTYQTTNNSNQDETMCTTSYYGQTAGVQVSLPFSTTVPPYGAYVKTSGSWGGCNMPYAWSLAPGKAAYGNGHWGNVLTATLYIGGHDRTVISRITYFPKPFSASANINLTGQAT